MWMRACFGVLEWLNPCSICPSGRQTPGRWAAWSESIIPLPSTTGFPYTIALHNRLPPGRPFHRESYSMKSNSFDCFCERVVSLRGIHGRLGARAMREPRRSLRGGRCFLSLFILVANVIAPFRTCAGRALIDMYGPRARNSIPI